MLPLPACSDAPIWTAWMGAFHAPTLAIADALGLFVAVRERPATAAELAAHAGIEVRAAAAMAGLLGSLGFLSHADGRFGLTDVARAYLLPESPYYWGGMLRRIRDNPLDCGKLIAGLRQRGAAASEPLTRMWTAPTPPPEALIAFTETMHAHSFALAMRVLREFPLAGVDRMLDVAGGSGSYSIAALLHHPDLRATLLDLEPVCSVATTYAARHEVADRLTAVPGDMFREPLPTGHDRVLFSDVFHDWDDERCALLARRAHDALAPGGRIWLHEMLLDDSGVGPAMAAAHSMIMVLITQGRQRTARELTGLLAGAGFTGVGVTATSGGFSLIEGTRP